MCVQFKVEKGLELSNRLCVYIVQRGHSLLQVVIPLG